jgi:ABC-2 type transport system ATP-binding protein
MTKRASIAQALAHQPDLFLLDEPLSGLDPLAMREMRELIAWLKAQGKTLLVSSHDIGEMARVCDAVAILSRGRLARAARRAEWDGRPERLEELFVQTVRAADDYEPMRFS